MDHIGFYPFTDTELDGAASQMLLVLKHSTVLDARFVSDAMVGACGFRSGAMLGDHP